MEPAKKKQADIRHTLILFATLFVTWIVLSGRLDAKLLGIGFFTSAVVAWITRDLLTFPSATGSPKVYRAFDLPVLKYILYWFWLSWQIVKANIEVALVILDPKLPINPQIVKFRKPMSNPLAHVTLANSITLTPGTITIDVRDDYYIIHALTDSSARGVLPEQGEGDLQVAVARLFGETEQGVRGDKGVS